MPLDQAKVEEWKKAAESWEGSGLHYQAEVVRALLAEVEWLEVLARMLNELVNSNSELVQDRDELLQKEQARVQKVEAEVGRLRTLLSSAKPAEWLTARDLDRAQKWQAQANEVLKQA